MRRALSPVITVVALALRPASGEIAMRRRPVRLRRSEREYHHRGLLRTTTTVSGSSVKVPLSSRSYVSDACAPGEFAHESYAAWALLGKSLSFTLDMSAGAGCGCNFAVYLTAMHQNEDPGSEGCGYDYYCDAAYVCGPTACTELDIAEGNQYAWHSTLHVANDEAVDTSGSPKGLGGGFNDFTSEQYGLGGSHVDTSKPFDVTAEFPKDASSGELSSITIKLEQAGGEPARRYAESTVPEQARPDDGLAQLTRRRGWLTPVIPRVVALARSSDLFFITRAAAAAQTAGRRLGQLVADGNGGTCATDTEQLHDRRSSPPTAHRRLAPTPAGGGGRLEVLGEFFFLRRVGQFRGEGETTGRGRAPERVMGAPVAAGVK